MTGRNIRVSDHYPLSRRERFEAWVERQGWFVQMLVYTGAGCVLGLALAAFVVMGRML